VIRFAFFIVLTALIVGRAYESGFAAGREAARCSCDLCVEGDR